MESTKTPKKSRRVMKNNFYMLGLIWHACPGVVVLSFVSSVMGAVWNFLSGTYVFKYALNALQEGEEVKNILITLGAIFAYMLLATVFQRLIGAYAALRRPRVNLYIRNMLQKKAVEVELACFERSDFYDVYVKATGAATDRAYNVLDTFSNLVWAIVNVSATASLVLTIDPIFLIPAFLPFTVNLLVGKKRNRIRYEYNMRNKEVNRQKDYVRRTFYLADFSKEMRMGDIWRVMFDRMSSSVTELKQIVKKYGYTLMFFRYLFDFVFDVLVYSGSIIVSVYKTLVAKDMLLGDCFVVINSITNIAGNIEYAGDIFFRLDEHSLYIENLRTFLEYETTIPEDESAPDAPRPEKFELRNVSFGYEGQNTPALNNVSFEVNAGEKIAIVGHNGAGKTTLIKLLLRLYDVGEGEILLNGENIKNYKLSSYRNLFGTVFQDYRLFAVSVAENVMLRGGLDEEDRAKVEEALKNSGISEKIHSLEKGIDTVVTKEFDEKGAVFSGGEAQKISIARIFAGKQDIVIMDEPTSALDPIAEQEMYKNMFAACEGKTVIFISHRLSSATMADRVYLFEKGEIIEWGTHAELLALGGKYADMWHKQADTYADDSEKEVTA